MNQENLEKFFWWIKERHQIHCRKAAGFPKPWTDDPILQSYRFTNVFRELDAVTVWIRENWREPFKDHDNLWFAMMIARQINWPETLAEIGFPVYDLTEQQNRFDYYEKIIAVANKRKSEDKLVYGHAYMIRGQTEAWIEKTGRRDKMHYTCYATLDSGWHIGAPTPTDTLESYCKRLATGFSWGDFTAFEVVTDLRHTHYLKNASDIMTWANTGPGAKRGLAWIFPDLQMKEEPMLDAMKFLLEKSKEYLPKDFPSLELRDIEHSLCEFHKYKRGYSKQKYKGEI